MDNRKLLNMGLVAGAVAIIAALVGYLFFWSDDNTNNFRNGKNGSGSSKCRMMDDGGCMNGGKGGMMDGMCGMMDEMMGGMDGMSGMMGEMMGAAGMMGGPTQSNTTPITIDQAGDAARRYVDKYNNPDLKVKNVVEFANIFYARVEEQGKNTGAFELLINRNNGVVTPEPGPNITWNTKYGSGAADDDEDDEDDDMMDGGSMGGMHEGMDDVSMDGMDGGMDSGSMDGMMDDDSMGGMHGGTSDSGGMMGGMHNGMSESGGMMDEGMCGMMESMMQSGMMADGMMNNGTARVNANATTDMPVKKDEARDRAQKYLDNQIPGAKAGEPVTFYGYYTLKVAKDDRTFGIISVSGDSDLVWFHSWLGVYLSGKQF